MPGLHALLREADPILLGQGPAPDDILKVFFWFALVAVAALAGFYLAVAIKRWSQRDDQVESFTFQDLRDMRARGEISPHEYDAMRAALLAEYGLSDDDFPEAERERRPSAGPDDPGNAPDEA
jgi:hypothetical protein